MHWGLTTPIIHEYHAKDVFMGFVDGNGLTQLISPSNKESLMKENKSFKCLKIYIEKMMGII